MGKYKAALLVLVAKWLKERGPEAEAAFLGQLSPEDAKCFKNALPLTWIPVAQGVRILQAAANVLYPDDDQALKRFGREEALDNLRGIYRALFKFASVALVLKQSQKIWRTYHDQGRCHAVITEKTAGYMAVEEYPDLPEGSRKILQGVITGIMELTGAKNVQVERDDSNPHCWKWNVRWE